eukprot:3416418-Pyramimonas_sp.AAC.1
MYFCLQILPQTRCRGRRLRNFQAAPQLHQHARSPRLKQREVSWVFVDCKHVLQRLQELLPPHPLVPLRSLELVLGAQDDQCEIPARVLLKAKVVVVDSTVSRIIPWQ